MKPRAKKFRIRRNTPPSGNGADAHTPVVPETDTALASQNDDQNPKGDASFAQDDAPMGLDTSDHEIDSIRREGLTGRQLRMARRVAQKHGLAPISDFDAVRLLRKKGIDPFQRSNMLELVVNDNRPQERAKDEVQLPQTVTDRPGRGVAPVAPESLNTAAEQVRQIQRDIARRRRRSMAMLFVRLALFVLLPGSVVGYYYYEIATPMYATKSEYVIQKAESAGGGGLGSLFGGTGLATQQDSTQVQGYLQSREAMQRLDGDLGFRSHFSQPYIDFLQRMEPDATDEQAYKTYKRNLKISYDPTEGIIKMEVVAADPQTSAAFSEALISYAEERVDGLTQRVREDQMSGARQSYEDAEQRVQAAQERVLTLQEKLGILDPTIETSSLMSQITSFEAQLREKRLQLDGLLDNERPNQARVDGVRGDIGRLETLVNELRASMTQSTSGTDSLARISAELRMAESELVNRQALLQQALQQLESARIEANRQVRYLSVSVTPVAPDEATYPRKFENTILAFLIFGGIYLMISMTASILKEQVSA